MVGVGGVPHMNKLHHCLCLSFQDRHPSSFRLLVLAGIQICSFVACCFVFAVCLHSPLLVVFHWGNSSICGISPKVANPRKEAMQ